MGLGNDGMDDRRKTSHSETLENTVAIAKVTEMISSLTKDTDRLVKHVEKILPIHAVIAYLKNLLYVGMFVASSFAVWITIEHFDSKERLNTFHALQEKENQELQKQITHNKNQIQYLKGRVK